MDFSDLCYIDATGYHYPDYPTVLSWLTGKYQSIYGADVYLEADSQDGQWLAIQAKAMYDMAAQGAAIYNSFSPLTAQGAGLSRVVKINGLKRNVPSYSTVVVTIVGTGGTVITNGVVQDTLGQKWNLPSTVTIPGGGSIDVTATAQTIGLVTAQSGTVTKIFTPTQGWQSVTNALAATPGSAVESDSALRGRQSLSTSMPALTVFDATLAAVANVSGVSKTKGYENYTDSTDGNSLPPHSCCVVVVGGGSTDIANAIMSKKTPGTTPTGNTGPISVTDNKGMPVNIYFSRAVTAEIQATINVVAGTGWSNNYVASIQAAVAAVINAVGIGGIVYLSQMFPAALLVDQDGYGTFSISSITLGKNGGAQSAANIALATGLNAENPVNNGGTDIVVNVS